MLKGGRDKAKEERSQLQGAPAGQAWANVNKVNNDRTVKNHDPSSTMSQVHAAINKQMGKTVELFLTAETQLINSGGVME